jgi:hypothetical protein
MMALRYKIDSASARAVPRAAPWMPSRGISARFKTRLLRAIRNVNRV